MSSVKEQQQQKRMEAERLQKQADKQIRQEQTNQKGRSQFQNMVKQGKLGQAQERMAQMRQGQARDAKNLKSLAKGLKQQSTKNARLARQGAAQTSRAMEQAQSFHTKLEGNQQQSAQVGERLNKKADESRTETKSATEERVNDFEQKSENKKDAAKAQSKADAAAKGRVNGAIDGDTKKGDGQSGQNDGMAAEAAAKAQRGGAAAPAEAAQGARPVEIPEAVMDALVKDIYVGVDVNGVSMFHVELKPDVFGGGSLQVKAQDGKVQLSFGGLDKNAQALVHSSRGGLMRRLEARGLSLDELTFT